MVVITTQQFSLDKRKTFEQLNALLNVNKILNAKLIL